MKALLRPLYLLYNQCLPQVCFSNRLKLTHDVPMSITDNKNCFSNDMSIAILFSLSKIFDSVQHWHIFVQIYYLPSPKQRGFMSNRSTCTHLIHLVESVDDAVTTMKYMSFIQTFRYSFSQLVTL